MKIKKYLIRQTYYEESNSDPFKCSDAHSVDSSQLYAKNFKKLSFIEFLYEVGMFQNEKPLKQCSRKEKELAYQRYIDALSASIRGSGSIFMKRDPKDVFTNNFNSRLMGVHQANHDLQIVVDQVILRKIVHI